MNKKTTNQISEGLEFEDLKGLVSAEISIDQYKPKIGTEEDTVVIAFTVTYESPAKDLSNFIESSDLEHLDVDVSTAPEADGTYRVFVEFQRDYNLFEKIDAMLNGVNQITSKNENEWTYVAFRAAGKETEFNKENFDRDIIDSTVKYRMKYLQDVDVTEELSRLKNLVKY